MCWLASASRPLLSWSLDRDHRLVGEGLNQCDLLVGEGPHRLALQGDHADRRSFAQQRHAQDGSDAADLRSAERKLGIGQDVVDLDNPALGDRPANGRAAPRWNRMFLHELDEIRRIAKARNLAIMVSGLLVDRRHMRFVQPRCRLDRVAPAVLNT